MNIVSRDIYRPWRAINNGDMYRLFDVALPASRTKASWIPAVDIEEQERYFVLTADLPGIDIDDVEIMMSEGVLSLKGKRASCREDSAGEVRCAERVSGEFKRSFSLPDTADPNGITANYRNGVLKVTITKEEKTAPKRIKIKALSN